MNRVKRQFRILMNHNMDIFIELFPSYTKLCSPYDSGTSRLDVTEGPIN